MCLYLCMSSPCNSDSVLEMATKKVLICCQILSSSISLYCFPWSSLGGMHQTGPFWECSLFLWILVASVEIFHLSSSPSEWVVEGSGISSLSYLFTACHYSFVCFCPSPFPGSLHASATKASILLYSLLFNVFVEACWRWSSSQLSVFISSFESISYANSLEKIDRSDERDKWNKWKASQR